MNKQRFTFALALLALLVAIHAPQGHAEVFRPKYRGFNISAPGANTDIFPAVEITSSDTHRLVIQIATGSVVNLMVTRGGVEVALSPQLNAAVTADATYSWDFDGLMPGDSVTAEVETDSAVTFVAFGTVKQ